MKRGILVPFGSIPRPPSEGLSIAVENVAGTGAPFRGQVVGVEQLANPQREAATADAPTEAVPESFEHGYPGVDTRTPRVGQSQPVLLVGGATLRQRSQSSPDLIEGEPDLLGHQNERHPADDVAGVAALPPVGSG